MSLVVWLPLTKDLRQQGLRNIEFFNSGITQSSTGKLGGSYYFAGNVLATTNFSISHTAWSVCYWVNYTTLPSSSNFYQVTLNGSTSTDYLFMVGGYSANGTTGVFRCNMTGDCGTINKNTWYHVCATYDGFKCRLYVNGELLKTFNITVYANKTNLTIGGRSNSSTNDSWGGRNGYCYLNDVRIYDHTLSLMEIKQISQGLVLHYPLDGVSNTKVPFGYQELEYIESTGSSYFNTEYKFNPEIDDCKVIFKGNDTENNGMIFADSGGKYFWIYYYRAGSRIALYASNGTAQQSVDYIAQDLDKHIVEYNDKTFYIDGVNKGSLTNTYSEDTNTIWLFSYGGSSYPFKGRIYYTEIKRNNKFQKVYIPAKRLSDSAIGMYELIDNEFFVSASSTFTAGPIIGSSSIIYDTSGFNNNGYIYQYDDTSLISIDTNSPRYSCATIVQSAAVTHAGPGTAYVVGDISISTPKELSICFWVNPISAGYGNSYGQGIFCTTIGTNTGTDYLTSAMNQYDDMISVNSSNSGTRIAPPFVISTGWHHYTITFNGEKVITYKDGVEVNNRIFSSTQTLGSFDHVFFGFSKAGSVWRRNKCKWSDCRVYATALSADDVKKLYQNSAYIDNANNVYAATYTEV